MKTGDIVVYVPDMRLSCVITASKCEVGTVVGWYDQDTPLVILNNDVRAMKLYKGHLHVVVPAERVGNFYAEA